MQLDSEKQRKEGNELFQLRKYSAAISKYSEALANLDPNTESYAESRSIILSNRCQCFLSMTPKNYNAALADAQMAISHGSHSIKTRYRLVIALQGLQRYEDALVAIEDGLLFDAENVSLLKLKNEVTKALTLLRNPASKEEEIVLQCLNNILSAIKTSSVRIESIQDGMLKSLFDGEIFASLFEAVQPTKEGSKISIPSDIQDLMKRVQFEKIIVSSFPKLAKGVMGMFESLQSRGAAEGHYMDAPTKSAVLLHVSQEALGREIISRLPEYIALLVQELTSKLAVKNDESQSMHQPHICKYYAAAVKTAVPRSSSAWGKVDIDSALDIVEETDEGDKLRKSIEQSLTDMIDLLRPWRPVRDELVQLLNHILNHEYEQGLRLCSPYFPENKTLPDDETFPKDVAEGIIHFCLTLCAVATGEFVLVMQASNIRLRANGGVLSVVLESFLMYLCSLASAGLNNIYMAAVFARNSSLTIALPGIKQVQNFLREQEILRYRCSNNIAHLVMQELKHIKHRLDIQKSPRCIPLGVARHRDFAALLAYPQSINNISIKPSLDVEDGSFQENSGVPLTITRETVVEIFNSVNSDIIETIKACFYGAQSLYEESLYLSAEVKYIAALLLLLSPENVIQCQIDLIGWKVSMMLNVASCRILRKFNSTLARSQKLDDAVFLCTASASQIIVTADNLRTSERGVLMKRYINGDRCKETSAVLKAPDHFYVNE